MLRLLEHQVPVNTLLVPVLKNDESITPVAHGWPP
jgi:hypothetical protein